MPGLFVTFEGGEGSGKSTQIERLAERLKRRGLDPVVTREPGGTTLGEGARALLLDPAHRPDARTEVFLLEAARAELVASVIGPALAGGRVVLCDRYLELAAREPQRFVVIDAAEPPAVLAERIAAAVEQRLAGAPAPGR